jgi:hypothetical protein
MILKFTTFLIILSNFYFFGCNSGPYTIDESDRPDSIAFAEKPVENETAPLPTYTVEQLKKKYPKKTYRLRTTPAFTFQFNAGFNYGLAELNANYSSGYEANEYENGENFGARQGFTIFSLGKIPLNNDGSIKIIFIGDFNYFINNSLTSKFSQTGSVKYIIYSVGGGFENSFTPAFNLKPYFGVSVLCNIITGRNNYINNLGENIDTKIKPSLRIGLDFNGGVEYLINRNYGLNFGISLTSANLLLKSSNVSNEPGIVPLRDKRVVPSVIYGGYKQFLFTSFFIGVNFYFGIIEKGFHL